MSEYAQGDRIEVDQMGVGVIEWVDDLDEVVPYLVDFSESGGEPQWVDVLDVIGRAPEDEPEETPEGHLIGARRLPEWSLGPDWWRVSCTCGDGMDMPGVNERLLADLTDWHRAVIAGEPEETTP